MTDFDERIKAALAQDEDLLPDLSLVRHQVGRARLARRHRNGWVAGVLMAACVLVVSSAVAMSAFRAGESSVAIGADTGTSTGTGTSTSTSTRTVSVAARTSNVPPTGKARPAPSLVVIPRVAQNPDNRESFRHCQSQSIAWPVTDGGRVDTVALRQAVNECSVGFGDGPVAVARYSLPTLGAVIGSSELFTGAAVPAAVDRQQKVLVVRLDGSAGVDSGATVQFYLTAGDAQWIGAEAGHPVDPSAFGAPVLPVP